MSNNQAHTYKQGHSHHNHSDLKGRNLLISIFLNILITVSQVIGGLISGSLALLSDALHNFSDVVSLIISFIADKLSRKKASTNKTFGYKRAEIIAAFINASTLIIVAILLIIEAIKRFQQQEEIEYDLVIWLSLLGILANGFSVLLLKDSAKNNMNMRSAYLHLLTDMMASVAVLIGGILMKFYQVYWIDNVLTLLIAIYLIGVAYQLLLDSVKVLMLFTPEDLSVKEIANKVNEMNSVKNIHHIHIWQLNDREVHLEAHIDFEEDITISKFDEILDEIELLLYNEYQINHINIQPEYRKCDEKDIIVQD